MTVGQYDAPNLVDYETGGVAGPGSLRVEGPRGGGSQHHHSGHHLGEDAPPVLRGGGALPPRRLIDLHREIPLHARTIYLLWPEPLQRVSFPHRSRTKRSDPAPGLSFELKGLERGLEEVEKWGRSPAEGERIK